jgi:membrane protease YdiL (CAAX protease family)
MIAEEHDKPRLNDLFAGLRWQPDRDTLVAILSYVLVVAALYTAFQLFTTERVAANFILFGPVGLALLGVGIPVFYTSRVRHRPLADLGITTRYLVPSLILSLLVGYDTYRNTLATMDVEWGQSVMPIVGLALMVGFFEAIFFRGWLQLRFEEAFGLVPGLLLGALCYSLYHVGYGMESSELLFLFFLGVTFGAIFRLTKSIFVLWPFYTPVGGLFTNLSDKLEMPFAATFGFVLTMLFMVVLIFLATRRQRPEEPAIQLAH